MKQNCTFVGYISFLVLLYLLWVGYRDFLHQGSAAWNGTNLNPNPGFLWHSITPTKELIWHNCYKGLQCARLEVPLNYSEPHGKQAAIALARKPALISPRLPFYRGPVLFNPGGPGGSGVDLITRIGSLFSIILGPQFDIVGFDPRGVGRSTPRVSFFDTDVERAIFSSGVRPVNSTDEGISRTWAVAQIMGKLAADSDNGYLANINTPNTARDMLSIIQAHGQEKLQYWGFSYGSVLGATFAAMFPDKVERLVIDGVMDAEDYYTTDWKTNLVDAEKALNQFYTGCAEAGQSRCPLYSPDADDIKKNLTELIEKVRRQPIPVTTQASPYASFSTLANSLASLSAGDGSSLLSFLPRADLPLQCPSDPQEYEFNVIGDAQIAIICNDGAEVPRALADTEDHFRELSKTSQFADFWAGIRAACVGWPKITPSASFDGPFVANTSHPLLIVGNTADPVTPLSSAHKMSRGFANSVVLTQDSPGHASVAAPSICTQLHIRNYFVHGNLPKPGTICKVDAPLFPPKLPGKGNGDRHRVQTEPWTVTDESQVVEEVGSDSLLWDAIEKVSLAYPIRLPVSMGHRQRLSPLLAL